ncbi:MAG: lactonase family protein [Candidatus Rokuibacteriota bacterium]
MRGAYRVAIWTGLVTALAAGALMTSPAGAASFVYVGNAESNEVYVLQLNQTNGDLAVIDKTPIPGIEKPGNSTPMSVSPDRRVLYVGTRGEPKAAAGFAIDPSSGKLKYIASGPLADSLAYIAVDRTGRFLLGASYPGHRVTVNPIASPGKVSPPQQVLENYPNAHAIFADPANRFVLVPTLGNDRINQFAFDAASGRLTPTTSPAAEARPKAGPRHFVYHPGGKLVYVIGELDGAVYVFDYNAATGDLKQKQVVSALPAGFQGKPSAADLHITPNGKFLYGSERTTSTLTGFQVDAATGTLTPIGSVPTEKQPRGFAIDPSGRYLLAVGQLSHGMSSYAIDQSTGKLTKLKEYPMGKNPNWVEIVDLP